MDALRTLTLASCLLTFACHIDPVLRKARTRPADSVELFRRARFAELDVLHAERQRRWMQRLRPSWVAAGEGDADWRTRKAYREGDAFGALSAAVTLPRNNRTRRMIVSLLDNVDRSKKLRASTVAGSHIDLPLDASSLAKGLPVVEMRTAGRTFRMLWDTGATENILHPNVAEELELTRTDMRFVVQGPSKGYVVRFATTGLEHVGLGDWGIKNIPWLVTDLKELENEGRAANLDGIISPQLMIPDGCFEIDRARAVLHVGFDARECRSMLSKVAIQTSIFEWNGEVFASAQIFDSPELAVQLETGSPITYLRADATRYLPSWVLQDSSRKDDGDIAFEMGGTVPFHVGSRTIRVAAIDMQSRRRSVGHDEIAALGTDLLLRSGSVLVSFTEMKMGFAQPPPAFADATH